MSKSIFDTRFTKPKKMALDAAVKKAFYALDKALNISGYAKDADDGDQQWITIKGARVLIDGNGKVIGGAEGKFNGSNYVMAAAQAATKKESKMETREEHEKNERKRAIEIYKKVDKVWDKADAEGAGERHTRGRETGEVRMALAKELGGAFEEAAKEQNWKKNFDELADKYEEAEKKENDFRSKFGPHMKGATPAEKRMATRLWKAKEAVNSKAHNADFVKNIEHFKSDDCKPFTNGTADEIRVAERNRNEFIKDTNERLTDNFTREKTPNARYIKAQIEEANCYLDNTNAKDWYGSSYASTPMFNEDYYQDIVDKRAQHYSDYTSGKTNEWFQYPDE